MHWSDWEVELHVGETLQIGDVRITVVDVEGDEVVFQMEQPDCQMEHPDGEAWLPLTEFDRQAVLPR